ncbi:hypothetical protein F5B20DRAFT_582121 [Whalleya microplaca]|nr:hypothetical protein F5B20DRAFT_582121 [Whalleya microplaca]
MPERAAEPAPESEKSLAESINNGFVFDYIFSVRSTSLDSWGLPAPPPKHRRPSSKKGARHRAFPIAPDNAKQPPYPRSESRKRTAGADRNTIPAYVRVPPRPQPHAHPKTPTPGPAVLLPTRLDGYRPDSTTRTDEFLAPRLGRHRARDPGAGRTISYLKHIRLTHLVREKLALRSLLLPRCLWKIPDLVGFMPPEPVILRTLVGGV